MAMLAMGGGGRREGSGRTASFEIKDRDELIASNGDLLVIREGDPAL